MSEVKNQARQGDIYFRPLPLLLEKIDSLPEDMQLEEVDFNKENRLVLAYGEVTGHAHAIYSNDAKLFSSKKTPHLYLVVNNPVSVKHEEHDEIKLPGKSVFLVKRQREYTRGEVRAIAD